MLPTNCKLKTILIITSLSITIILILSLTLAHPSSPLLLKPSNQDKSITKYNNNNNNNDNNNIKNDIHPQNTQQMNITSMYYECTPDGDTISLNYVQLTERNYSGYQSDEMTFCQVFVDRFGEEITEGKMDQGKGRAVAQEVLWWLSEYVTIEPDVAIDEDCVPPQLREVDCEAHSNVFTGERRTEDAKIAVLLNMGFEVDALEIALMQYYDLVDKIFIVESELTHLKGIRKPVMYDLIRGTDRFRRFEPKIIHHVVKENCFESESESIWYIESVQNQKRWESFYEWNEKVKYFGDDDLIIIGAVDEIPGRDNINSLKKCELSVDKLDFGIWFPMGKINEAFRTDHPARGHPYSIAIPAVYTLKGAKEHSSVPSIFSSKGTQRYLLGGAHMSNYNYLPAKILKDLSCTECGGNLPNYLEQCEHHSMDEMQRTNQLTNNLRGRITSADKVTDGSKEIPWFYNCNRNRYPVWEGNLDTRLN